jgi:hypothetical protein
MARVVDVQRIINPQMFFDPRTMSCFTGHHGRRGNCGFSVACKPEDWRPVRIFARSRLRDPIAPEHRGTGS